MLPLRTPIEEVSGIASRNKTKLHKLGIENVRDMLWHIPVRWEDFSETTTISSLAKDEKGIVLADIVSVSGRRAWKKKFHITEAILKDDTGTIKAVWFNQPYLSKVLEPGKRFYFSGKVVDYYGLTLSNPTYERSLDEKESLHFKGLTPIYPLTEKLTQKVVRFIMYSIFEKEPALKEHLSKEILEEEQLMDLPTAVREVHVPSSEEKLKAALSRLKFEELFSLATANKKIKKGLKKQKVYIIDMPSRTFSDSLPYTLTKAQEKAIKDIHDDMVSGNHMNRLLEGDVGSGKTVVAAAAAYSANISGYQTALMAPTEVLAKQHFQNMVAMLSAYDIRIGLLTKSFVLEGCRGEVETKERTTLKRNIASGVTQFVIGTHSIIQPTVKFKLLALSIVDEQHRFGVAQRANLVKINDDGTVPHYLSLTATPIPRTYAHLLYGTVDLSILDEMPKGRKPIETSIVLPSEREKIYEHITEHISEGRQVYVICPLILESDSLGFEAVTTEEEKIQKAFPEKRIAVLHGKMSGSEKEEVLTQFYDHEIDILIATPVVEVGIDVPNATIMMIESPERFGLASLHQLRGRIGRGEHQSYCYVMAKDEDQKNNRRLKALEKHTDGFKLAEIDMKERGPGELRGVKQSGYMNLKIANLADVKTIKQVQRVLHVS